MADFHSFKLPIINLEGDGALIFSCFEELNTVYHSIQVANSPNVKVIAQRIAQGDHDFEEKLVKYAISCVKPAHDYFLFRFHNDLRQALGAFKAAQLFHPVKVSHLQPTA